jgi:N-acetylglucosaminyl-diphospho-decaprenol L-rhamnosyltransferase
MRPTMSVAVVSFNCRDLTLRCLDAAEKAAAGLNAAFTLVDNGSHDGTLTAAERAFPAWRTLLLSVNPGYGAALNRAFADVPAEYFLALNADIVLDPQALQHLRAYCDRTPKCAVAGPALRYPDGRSQPSAKRFPDLPFALAEVLQIHRLLPLNRLVRRFYYIGEGVSSQSSVDAVSGAAMLIRADAFRTVGGFDEGFWMYFEETDLCRRLRTAGFHVALVPAAGAVHCHGASTIQTSVREVEYYLSYVRYFRKHHGRRAARILASAVALNTMARMVALALKYVPVSRNRAHVLVNKLAACVRLLGQLRQTVARAGSAEDRP